jgi:hypothetical protein
MMRVFKKRLIRIIIFMMVISAPVNASNNQEYTNMLENKIITPYFTNISVFSSTLNISSYGKASVSSYLTARNVDNLAIEVDLQQLKDGRWISIKKWTESSAGTSGGLSGSYYVSKGYIYRTVSKGMVYKNGALLESTSAISKMESY